MSSARTSHERPANRQRGIYALLGLRPAFVQHSPRDDILLRNYAAEAQNIVEIGVLEGGSAIALRESMPENGHLWLIDPYISTIPGFSPRSIVAHRLLRTCRRGSLTWIRSYSQSVGVHWTGPAIDLIYIDGDHSFAGVEGDWRAWKPHLSDAAVAVFDDATRSECEGWGPQQLIATQINVPGSGWHTIEEGDRFVAIQRT